MSAQINLSSLCVGRIKVTPLKNCRGGRGEGVSEWNICVAIIGEIKGAKHMSSVGRSREMKTVFTRAE